VISVEQTIISQYAATSTIVQLVRNIDEYIDPRADIDTFYEFVWNVETAEGFGLDIWGRIVNVGRSLDVPIGTPNPGYFPFTPGPIELDDDQYRRVVLTKALANITNCTAESLNQLLTNLFEGRGRVYVRDTGSMTLMWTFEFYLEPWEYIIMSGDSVAPRPAGVLAHITQIDVEGIFGFDEAVQMQPFDQGVFYNPNPFPSATDVEYTGLLEYGETLTLTYDFYDPEGRPESGSLYRWQRSDDGLGMGSNISGAVATTYQIQAADSEKFIRAAVVPSNGIEYGVEAYSAYQQIPWIMLSLFLPDYSGFGAYGNALTQYFTTQAGSTLSGSAGQPIGRWERQAGSLNWTASDPVRPSLAVFPNSQIRNRVRQTESLNLSPWGASNLTIAPNATIAPNGTLTADKLAETAVSGQHPVSQDVTVTAGSWIASGYAKAAERTWFRLLAFDGTGTFSGYFDLANGVVGSVTGTGTTSGIESVGDGWYRCWIKMTFVAGAGSIGPRPADSNGNSNYLGVLNSGFYLWGVNMCPEAALSPYQKVTDPWDVTEAGVPSLYLPYGDGTEHFTSGTVSFGTATDGMFADSGNDFHVTVAVRMLANGTILAQCGATAGNRMFELYVAANVMRLRLRGTDNDLALDMSDGEFHIIDLDCANGVVTVSCDEAAYTTPTVGVAAAENEAITMLCHTASSPANIAAGHGGAMIIDRSLVGTELAQNNAYWNNVYRSGL
jgi:hypothetical protein